VAEARLGRAQKQVDAANEAAAELEAKGAALAESLQARRPGGGRGWGRAGFLAPPACRGGSREA
jgi:hypothetical protein